MSTLSEPIAAPMSRSEIKREAILEASKKVFLEHGYDVASMDKIAAKADVSKRTVYSHFNSKEDLFAQTMVSMCITKRAEIEMNFDLDAPIETVLRTIGNTFLDMIFEEESSSLLRILIGQADNFPEIGDVFLDNGPDILETLLGGYLREQEKKGLVQVTEPEEAASSFFASLFGVEYITVLVTGRTPPGPAKRKSMVDNAVDRFLRGTLVDKS